MKNVLLVISCVMFLFSCSTNKTDVVISDVTTKYDISLNGFEKSTVKGLVGELVKLPIYIKYNILDFKENAATLTYTTHDDGRNIAEITKTIEDYLVKQGSPADVNYASGMFKINRRK